VPHRPSVAILGLVLVLAPTGARADLVTTVEAPFLGITHTHVSGTLPSGQALAYDAVDVDLSAPGVHFLASPGLPLAPGQVAGHARPQTTREFVASAGAQVGINANFFASPTAPPFDAYKVNGFVASGGVVSAAEDGPGLNISAGNAVTFFDRSPAGVPGFGPGNAVSGSVRLIRGGVLNPFAGDDRHARTAIGLTAAGHLLLLTVDGKNPGHSDGLTLNALESTLQSLGAVDAINLDGGGSTTLVLARGGTPTVANVPSGDALFPVGTERPVAISLAVFAQAVPEPSALALLTIGTAVGLGTRRARRRMSDRVN